MTLQKRQSAKQPAKTIVFGTISVMLGVIGCLSFLEIGLQFLPVSSSLRSSQAVTAKNPFLHFQPNSTVTYSHSWDFKMLNFRHVNNAGWVNDQDYKHEDTRPLLAVIGDSYVEAAMVSYPETMYGRIAETFEGKLKVYSFGTSGASLSQYLILAQHAVREYGAKAVIINVVGNDFDESHIAYLTGPGWWVYVPGTDGQLRLRLVEYRPGLVRSLAYKSALARYVFFNLQLANTLRGLKNLLFGSPAIDAPLYAGNTAADFDTGRMNASLAVIDAAFRDLPDIIGLPPNRILFTLDGFRYPEAMPNDDNYFGMMRQAFIAKARSLHYEVIDLDRWFFSDYAKRHERFQYPTDGHWNSIGHEVVARSILASDLLHALERELDASHIRSTSN
jgi:hypothetical protein